MTLSVDDEITIAEVAVILIGIAITWAVYYRSGDSNTPSSPDPVPPRGPGAETVETDGRTVE
jgi:hypothetical protein